ncbi:hypothetical protein BKD09_19550 [Bradyrhizobium japonicum]|uniref:Uncharacterized protein n=1 Tax=Bradyrhizobium japonicum TaxID=375 RepID=A0A1L3FB50_BRAJP|nr:hypothetical protein BKD09_19550 [Bradyrhizobium japonicum]
MAGQLNCLASGCSHDGLMCRFASTSDGARQCVSATKGDGKHVDRIRGALAGGGGVFGVLVNDGN